MTIHNWNTRKPQLMCQQKRILNRIYKSMNQQLLIQIKLYQERTNGQVAKISWTNWSKKRSWCGKIEWMKTLPLSFPVKYNQWKTTEHLIFLFRANVSQNIAQKVHVAKGGGHIFYAMDYTAPRLFIYWENKNSVIFLSLLHRPRILLQQGWCPYFYQDIHQNWKLIW